MSATTIVRMRAGLYASGAILILSALFALPRLFPVSASSSATTESNLATTSLELASNRSVVEPVPNLQLLLTPTGGQPVMLDPLPVWHDDDEASLETVVLLEAEEPAEAEVFEIGRNQTFIARPIVIEVEDRQLFSIPFELGVAKIAPGSREIVSEFLRGHEVIPETKILLQSYASSMSDDGEVWNAGLRARRVLSWLVSQGIESGTIEILSPKLGISKSVDALRPNK